MESQKSCYYMTTGKTGSCQKNQNTAGLGDQCKLNIKYCKKDSDAYHKLCDRYWDTTDEQIEQMSEEQIDKAIEDLDVCLYMRERHMEVCVHPDCQDRGHQGAIDKLKKKLGKMKKQKYSARLTDLTRKLMGPGAPYPDSGWTLDDIDRLVEESLKKDKIDPLPSTKRLTLPLFPTKGKLDVDKYLASISYLMHNTIKMMAPTNVIPEYMVILKLPTGEEIIGMNETAEGAKKELLDLIVETFGSPDHKIKYKEALARDSSKDDVAKPKNKGRQNKKRRF